jgi:hypothetical protein
MPNVDEIMSAGAPYFRVIQPKTCTAVFTEASYFRLGSYIQGAAQEEGLVTGLTTTTSTVTKGEKSAIDQAGDAIKNVKGDPAKDFKATSQATETYTTTASDPIASSGNGVLIYTDSDFQQNVKGASLAKYGQGHVTEVAAADAKYAVKAGKYDISATNGIFIKAGSFDAAGKTTAGANIELTAGGYIKQTAYGDLDEVTYGITHKRFHGIANDMFMGLKFSFFFGLETSVKLAGRLTIIMSAEASFRLSTRFSLTISSDLKVFVGGSTNFFFGAKIDTVTGVDMKTVIGASTKIVVGADFKQTVSDLKIVATTDIKAASGDMKKVSLNMTICDIDLKKEFAAVEGSDLKAVKGLMEADMKEFFAKKASVADVSLSTLTAIL